MVPYTRRRTLQGAAALLTGLAGCGGSTSGSSRSNEMGPEDNVDLDPPNVALRHHRNEPPIWIDDTRDSDTESTTEQPWRRGTTRGLIASRETAQQLTIADIEGREEVLQFLEHTDFTQATLVLDATRVDECYHRDLCYVTWSATRYHTYYARHYREASVACSTDAHDGIAHLIRIPDTLDPDEVTGSGTGTTSGSCHEMIDRRRARQDSGAGEANQIASLEVR